MVLAFTLRTYISLGTKMIETWEGTKTFNSVKERVSSPTLVEVYKGKVGSNPVAWSGQGRASCSKWDWVENTQLKRIDLVSISKVGKYEEWNSWDTFCFWGDRSGFSQWWQMQVKVSQWDFLAQWNKIHIDPTGFSSDDGIWGSYTR